MQTSLSGSFGVVFVTVYLIQSRIHETRVYGAVVRFDGSSIAPGFIGSTSPCVPMAPLSEANAHRYQSREPRISSPRLPLPSATRTSRRPSDLRDCSRGAQIGLEDQPGRQVPPEPLPGLCAGPRGSGTCRRLPRTSRAPAGQAVAGPPPRRIFIQVRVLVGQCSEVPTQVLYRMGDRSPFRPPRRISGAEASGASSSPTSPGASGSR